MSLENKREKAKSWQNLQSLPCLLSQETGSLEEGLVLTALPRRQSHAPLIWFNYYLGLQWESRVVAGCRGVDHPSPPTNPHVALLCTVDDRRDNPGHLPTDPTPYFFRSEMQIFYMFFYR